MAARLTLAFEVRLTAVSVKSEADLSVAGQAAEAEATPSEVVLPPLVDALDLKSQQRWLAAEIQLWLDDEWTKLDVHRELGVATAQVLC